MKHSPFFLLIFFLLEACTRPNGHELVSEEGYIDAGHGVQLYYQKLGTGKNKIIIPLGSYLYDGLKPLAESGERTVVFYDVRNRGRSSHVTDSSLISIWNDVEDLEKVRKHFAFEKVSLVGWSYLGMMVMLYSADHAQHVDRIAQIGPVALKWNEPFPPEFSNTEPSPVDTIKSKELEQLIQQGYHLKDPQNFTFNWYRVNVYPDLFGDTSLIKQFEPALKKITAYENEYYHNFMWHLSHHFVGSVMNMNTDSLWREVKKIKQPVLTVHGTKDRNAAFGAGRQWATQLENARLLPVEGAAHVPWMENPQLVITSLSTFFDGQWPAQAIKLRE